MFVSTLARPWIIITLCVPTISGVVEQRTLQTPGWCASFLPLIRQLDQLFSPFPLASQYIICIFSPQSKTPNSKLIILVKISISFKMSSQFLAQAHYSESNFHVNRSESKIHNWRRFSSKTVSSNFKKMKRLFSLWIWASLRQCEVLRLILRRLIRKCTLLWSKAQSSERADMQPQTRGKLTTRCMIG